MLLLEVLLEMSMHDARQLIASYIPDFPMNAVTPEAVSRARRQLAKRFHPDRGGDEVEMKRVNDALDVLEKDEGGAVRGEPPFWANRGWTKDPNRPKRHRNPEDAKRLFVVFGISRNANSFGLRGVIIVAENGEAWQIGVGSLYANDLSKGSRLWVTMSDGTPDRIRREMGGEISFEIPERIKDAPQDLVDGLFR